MQKNICIYIRVWDIYLKDIVTLCYGQLLKFSVMWFFVIMVQPF